MPWNNLEKQRAYQIEYRKRDYVKLKLKGKYLKKAAETRNTKYIPKYQALRIKLKQEKGGKCQHCGFDEEIRILHFHHLRDKLFVVSDVRKGETAMRKEAEKCILLCPNCHAKVHLKNNLL